MLDDLRNSASQSFQEEEEPQQQPPQKPRGVIRIRQDRRDPQPFLGLTPEQRFLVALLLFMMVSVMGVLLLVATNKVFIF